MTYRPRRGLLSRFFSFTSTRRTTESGPVRPVRPAFRTRLDALEERVLLSGFCAQAGTETVLTDKADYSPEETVHIAGTGYGPSCDVTVTVTRPDGSVVH